MVSNFIDEKNGYLPLTKDEYDRGKCADPPSKTQAGVFLEYGESKEGYWASERFMKKIKMAFKLLK